MDWYNGYSPAQRNAILREYHRKKRKEGFQFAGGRCAICDDPECPADSWHSEDYSQPFSFVPPASYAVCHTCHNRLHKRFNQPDEWRLFLEHLKCGGYGREFTKSYSLPHRRAWVETIRNGGRTELPRSRPRNLTGSEWWLGLTLDPQSLTAAWARPRPFRPRPDKEEFVRALAELRPTPLQTALLRFHAAQPRRTATMREIARGMLGSDRPTDANLAYGTLARRLCKLTRFKPDLREDGSEVWMSTVAEGWQPENGEFEWVMAPSLVAAIK